ncbi:MAG: DUF5011 domain-containing protein [Bacteroidia bacterium]|nr:DUF5011 domain-containing protein [Bacteroidia bacterium]
MKKQILSSLLLIWGAVTLFSGCKIDGEPPVVTLLGSDDITHFVGEPFTDPGVTAIDNEDGDITTDVTVSYFPVPNTGTITAATDPGVYHLTYFSQDQSGNSNSATRYVTVTYGNQQLLGTYSVEETSQFGTNSYTGTVTADTTLDIVNFAFSSVNAPNQISVEASIYNRETVNLENEISGGPISSFYGNVTGKDTFRLELNYVRPPNGSVITNCTAVWTKQ